MRFFAAMVFLLLVACTAPKQSDLNVAAPSQPATCQIGPNDGPVLAERGIGGTGLPQFSSPDQSGSTQLAAPAGQNRGIGGTGMPQTPELKAGSVGILGEITGFASICINGVEVEYNPVTNIQIDGVPAPSTALRAGQVVAITADSYGSSKYTANKVAIRHEVSGPVSQADAGMLIVAGQQIILNAGTRGATDIHSGDWVSVSGFRNLSGEVVATRLDARPPGIAYVHGKLKANGGKFWLGTLELQLPPQIMAQDGEWITVSGSLANNILAADVVTPDLLFSKPSAYFGREVNNLSIETFAVIEGNSLRLPGGGVIPRPAGLAPASFSRPAILSLHLAPGGGPILGPGAPFNPVAGFPKNGADLMPVLPGGTMPESAGFNGPAMNTPDFASPANRSTGFNGPALDVPGFTGPMLGVPNLPPLPMAPGMPASGPLHP